MIRLGTILLLCLAGAWAKYHHKSGHGEKGAWTVYGPEDFDENELCVVLSCRKHEVCMVRQNNAMCVTKHKVSQVEGEKSYYRKRHHPSRKEGHKKEHVYKKFDKERFREKMREYKQKHFGHEKPHHKNEYPKPHRPHPPHRPRHDANSPDDQCSEDDLKSMGGRLLQWFSDVHKTQPGAVAPLPKHHIRCRADVGWMFQQWDGDQDGRLTPEELNSLEGDRYEHCIKPFLDRCDVDADDLIDIDEWCDCFEWSDHLRDEPPCHKAQRKHDPHLLGSWVPRCDVEGFFRPEQCHEGYCFCVDRQGREFDHSRVLHAHADCGQYAEESDDEDLHWEGSGDRRDL